MTSSAARSGPPPRRFLFAALLAFAGISGVLRAEPDAGAYRGLAGRLDRKIAEFDWAGGEIGVMVADFRHGITSYVHNVDAPLRPGSATKLVTAAAALDRLGPGFTFSTELFARGEVTKGRLMGDLMIRGDGDPSITSLAGTKRSAVTSFLDRWTSAVKKEGITRVEGSLWVDASAFDDVPFAAGWPVERIVEADVPEISALNLNDNVIELLWRSGKKKNRVAEYETFPAVEDYLFFSNNVRIEEAQGAPRRFFRRPGVTTIAIEGALGRGATAHDRVTVPNPPLFFAHAFRGRLKSAGVELIGGVANWRDADLPVQESRALRRIDHHVSPPLSELLPPMLANDRTLDAEVLFKTLGRKDAGGPGTFENGSTAMTDIVRSWGVSPSGIVFLDGSGLSSFNRISARKMLGILEAVHRAPWQRYFDPVVPKISLERALHNAAGEGGPPPLSPELSVRGVAGAHPGGFAAAGWAETRGKSRLHFVILVDRSRLPTALIRSQVEVLMREIADTAIP